MSHTPDRRASGQPNRCMICWVGMFSPQRKTRVLFGLSDVVLGVLAFEAAYQTRLLLHLRFLFYFTANETALILGFSLLALVLIGLSLGIYEGLDSAHPRIILRDTARQCALGALCLVSFEYLLRMDLSRFFVFSFSVYTWGLMLLFRLTAGRVVGVIRREFAAPHYVMVVGTGDRAVRLARALEQSYEYGVRLRGFLSDTVPAPSEIVLRVPYKVLPVQDLPAILSEHVVDEIIFAVESDNLAPLEEVFL